MQSPRESVGQPAFEYSGVQKGKEVDEDTFEYSTVQKEVDMDAILIGQDGRINLGESAKPLHWSTEKGENVDEDQIVVGRDGVNRVGDKAFNDWTVVCPPPLVSTSVLDSCRCSAYAW